MKNKLVNINLICNQIFERLNKRKLILKDIYFLSNQLEKKKQELKQTDKEFRNLTVNISLYELFFKTYNIANTNNDEFFHVNKIQLVTYNDEQFYDVNYTYINTKTKQSSTSQMSLRKFLKLLDSQNFKLVEI